MSPTTLTPTRALVAWTLALADYRRHCRPGVCERCDVSGPCPVADRLASEVERASARLGGLVS